ncbi:M23 family metallopeptidase [Marivirga tractuosa]|uniref:M23 family metallopeptidase n=1 Tax=Marivirga tractuosa TaxID=1006 RepID=UPI0035CFCA95
MESTKITPYLRGFLRLKIYRVFYFLIFLYPFYEPFKYVIVLIVADVLYEVAETFWKKKSQDVLREPDIYHPNLFLQSFFQLIGIVWRTFYKPLKSLEPKTYKNVASFNLPFAGKWFVYNGGITKDKSHSWNIYNQRYAYDFVIQDMEGKSYQNNPHDIEDYYCFEAEVLCPADGKVIEVKDGLADYTKAGAINYWAKDFRGNFVIIEHNDEEYSFIAHFKRHSIKVKPGQFVRRGELLGLCGNSGHSTEPHIHFHVQDSPNFYLGVGVPIKFDNLEHDGWVNNGIEVENK